MYGCTEVRVYPAECSEQLGRDPNKIGSSKSLVLKSFGVERTFWELSLPVSLTLWDTPALLRPHFPSPKGCHLHLRQPNQCQESSRKPRSYNRKWHSTRPGVLPDHSRGRIWKPWKNKEKCVLVKPFLCLLKRPVLYRRVNPCAVKTCAVRPVFARVVGELRAADPSNVQGPVEQNASPGEQSEAPRRRWKPGQEQNPGPENQDSQHMLVQPMGVFPWFYKNSRF